MNKCEICANRLKDKTLEPCASCDTLKIIRLEKRIAELEDAASKMKAFIDEFIHCEGEDGEGYYDTMQDKIDKASARIAELEVAYNSACVYIAENRDCPYDEFDVEPEGDCEHLCPDRRNPTICWKWYFVGKSALPPMPEKE